MGTDTQADSITIVLDLPPEPLHQNSRANHYAKASAAAKYRKYAAALCLEKGLPASCPWEDFQVSMLFCWPSDHRNRDVLNYAAAMKSAIDGMGCEKERDAGVFVDDWRLRVKKIDWVKDPEQGPWVVVMVEQIRGSP